MKKLIFVSVSILLLLFSCSKDPIDDVNRTSKNCVTTSNHTSNSTIMRVWFTSLPDYSLPKVQVAPQGYNKETLPGGGWMEGHSDITKIVDPLNSHYVFTSSILGPGSKQTTSTLAGTITCQQYGCSYYYTANIITDFENLTISGTLNILGGTGRYKGISKILDLTGTMNPENGESTWIGIENTNPQNK
jgi:hypothetical protein